MSHTPGPWGVKRGQSCLHVVSADDSMHTGCISFSGNGAANARLIAAAPELLSALKLMVEHYGDPLKVARAAIAKAEGV